MLVRPIHHSENIIIPTILSAIEAQRKGTGPFIIAIDGRCASGKSTLAEALGHHLSCPVIHMDHFFLRPEQRTPERLSIPGENVDHERFLTEVMIPLSRGEVFAYRPFDCGTAAMADPVSVPRSPVYLIEGSYSCHPSLRDYYDLRIFLSVDPEEQMRRILRRNGEKMAELFRTKWIPMEEQYFASHAVAACCDLQFTT